MPGYREFRFFCPFRDGEAVRLSMVDDHGREYFAIVGAEPSRGYRDRREQALTAIEDAIMAGQPPGEIRVGSLAAPGQPACLM